MIQLRIFTQSDPEPAVLTFAESEQPQLQLAGGTRIRLAITPAAARKTTIFSHSGHASVFNNAPSLCSALLRSRASTRCASRLRVAHIWPQFPAALPPLLHPTSPSPAGPVTRR